jgi:hypothetical protein
MNKLFSDVFKVNQKIEDGLAEEKKEEEEPKDEIMQAAMHVEKVVNMKGKSSPLFFGPLLLW